VDQRPAFIRNRLETHPVADSRKADKPRQDMQEPPRDLSLPFSLFSVCDVPVFVLFNDTRRYEPVAFKILELS
jgi:hypothetical protein